MNELEVLLRRAGQDIRRLPVPRRPLVGRLAGLPINPRRVLPRTLDREEADEPAMPSPLRQLPQTAGVATVLPWTFSHRSPPVPCGLARPSARPQPLASLDLLTATRLADVFFRSVYATHPIVEPAPFGHILRRVAERGPDASLSTCLVGLVCAIGALCQEPEPRALWPNEPDVLCRARLAEAEPYWDLALERLGLAFGRPGWRSVQCMCLAG